MISIAECVLLRKNPPRLTFGALRNSFLRRLWKEMTKIDDH